MATIYTRAWGSSGGSFSVVREGTESSHGVVVVDGLTELQSKEVCNELNALLRERRKAVMDAIDVERKAKSRKRPSLLVMASVMAVLILLLGIGAKVAGAAPLTVDDMSDCTISADFIAAVARDRDEGRPLVVVIGEIRASKSKRFNDDDKAAMTHMAHSIYNERPWIDMAPGAARRVAYRNCIRNTQR